MLGTEADAQLSREDTLPNDVPAAGQTAPGSQTSLALRGCRASLQAWSGQGWL